MQTQSMMNQANKSESTSRLIFEQIELANQQQHLPDTAETCVKAPAESDFSSRLGIDPVIQLSAHERSLIDAVCLAAKNFKRSESSLVLRFCELAKTQAFKKCGYPNLFTFAVKHLDLSEGSAYLLVKVAKKSVEIPQIIESLLANEVSLRTVGRLAPVLTAENAAALFARAKSLSSRELDHLVASLNPRAVQRDHRSAVNCEDTRISVTLDRKQLADLERCQEIMMQKRQGPVSLAETVAAVSADFLKRHAPEQKAARAEHRRKTKTQPDQANHEDLASPAEVAQSMRSAAMRVETCRGPSAAPIEQDALLSPGQPGYGLVSPMMLAHENINDASKGNEARGAQGINQATQQTSVFTSEEITPNPKNPRAIPAKIIHFVSQRDQHRCTHVSPAGERCGEKKFLHMHHRVALSAGGNHHPDNLTQLCAYHHDLVHQLSFADWAQSTSDREI